MKLKSIPRRLGYILGAQWTRDLSWTLFTILLSRQDPFLLGQIMLALGYGYLVKTAADVGLNEFLLSSFARRDARPTVLLGEVLWLKCALLVIALGVTWCIVASKANYSPELRLIVLCIAAGFGIDGISDTFFALCQARGRQDVEMRIRIPAAVLGIGFGMGATPNAMANMLAISTELEEAADIAGASFWKRMASIIIPLAKNGFISGFMLTFISIAKELDLIIIMMTPTTRTMSYLAFTYSQDGYNQMADAISVIVLLFILVCYIIANKFGADIGKSWG